MPATRSSPPKAARTRTQAPASTRSEVMLLSQAARGCREALAPVDTSAGLSQRDLVCLVDTAELCDVTAAFIARGSAYVHPLREVCAQQLRDLAGTCERVGGRLDGLAKALQDAQAALATSLAADDEPR